MLFPYRFPMKKIQNLKLDKIFSNTIWKHRNTFQKQVSVRKGVLLEMLQNSQENTCARVSFIIKLQALGLQLNFKKYSGTGVFLWILRNFSEHLFTEYLWATSSYIPGNILRCANFCWNSVKSIICKFNKNVFL